ncbi:MAG: hypothetical protein GXY55_14470 [Phycisphaerae bacterium]|nr:hypothetical protein [Phycisphaerae bacterium]
MSISAISSTTASTDATATASDLSGLSGTDFMEILVKQLQYQDPFEPMGNEQMISQMANIRELEMNTRLTERLEQLTGQQRFGSAAALIGKYAVGEISTEDGTAIGVEGIITGLRFTSAGDVILELDSGDLLPLASVERVADVSDTTATS